MFFEGVGLYKSDKNTGTTMYEVSISLARNMELLCLLSYLPQWVWQEKEIYF